MVRQHEGEEYGGFSFVRCQGREGKPKLQQSGKPYTSLKCGTTRSDHFCQSDYFVSSLLKKKLYHYTRPENASRISNIHSFLMYCIQIKLCESWPSELFSIRSGRRTPGIQRSRLLHRLWRRAEKRRLTSFLIKCMNKLYKLIIHLRTILRLIMNNLFLLIKIFPQQNWHLQDVRIEVKTMYR